MKNKEVIRDQLLKLAGVDKLTPDEVVKLAESPSSPLHELFVWDNDEAAHKYRLHQARTLISSFEISVTINRVELSVQEFVRNPELGRNEQGYVEVTSITNESDAAREFVQRELEIARTYVRRTESFARLLGLSKDIKSLGGRLEEITTSLSKVKK